MEVQSAVDENNASRIWLSPIQKTIATEGTGIPELGELIAQHRAHLVQSGDLERRERARLQNELELLLQSTLVARWRSGVTDGQYQNVLERLTGRELSPRQAVTELLNGGRSK